MRFGLWVAPPSRSVLGVLPSVFRRPIYRRGFSPSSVVASQPGPAQPIIVVVRHSRMWCPHDIGRDSWVWGEQETLYIMHSPNEVGEEALAEMISLSGGNRVARG